MCSCNVHTRHRAIFVPTLSCLVSVSTSLVSVLLLRVWQMDTFVNPLRSSVRNVSNIVRSMPDNFADGVARVSGGFRSIPNNMLDGVGKMLNVKGVSTCCEWFICILPLYNNILTSVTLVTGSNIQRTCLERGFKGFLQSLHEAEDNLHNWVETTMTTALVKMK